MKYKVLTNSRKYNFTINEKIWGILSVFIIYEMIKLSIFGNESANNFDKFILYCAIFCIPISLIIYFIKIFDYEKLNGELNGTLEFLTDKIILNGFGYELTEIRNISLNCYDYYGKSTISVSSNLLDEGGKSNGTGNKLILTLLDGKIIKINFVQEYENQIYNDKLIFVNYCNQGKLNYMNLLDNMGIKNYDKMQEFKKKYLIQFQ